MRWETRCVAPQPGHLSGYGERLSSSRVQPARGLCRLLNAFTRTLSSLAEPLLR